MSTSLQPHGLQPTRFLCPWDFPGKNTGVGCHFLLQEICPTQGLNLGLPCCRQTLYRLNHQGSLLLLLSRFSLVRLCAIPWTAAHQVPPSLGFSRQEHWSGLPLPSPTTLFLTHGNWLCVCHPVQASDSQFGKERLFELALLC